MVQSLVTRQMGTGPGIILLHGGAKASEALMQLGTSCI